MRAKKFEFVKIAVMILKFLEVITVRRSAFNFYEQYGAARNTCIKNFKENFKPCGFYYPLAGVEKNKNFCGNHGVPRFEAKGWNKLSL